MNKLKKRPYSFKLTKERGVINKSYYLYHVLQNEKLFLAGAGLASSNFCISKLSRPPSMILRKASLTPVFSFEDV